MITNTIARRYAKALVQLGAEEGAVEKFNTELTATCAVLADNPELGSIFRSPAYGIEAKREILRDIIGKLGLSVIVANFLQLILDRNRLDFLPQIAESYSAFADELSGVIRPTLSSGLPLQESQVREIKAALEKSTGKKVVLKVEVDANLIGGVVTTIGGTVYDGSVRTQLNKIEDILQKG
ncbi:MAG TPA: ATP synthase F1 subunit delta [Geobacteraceae bacterium]|nr:ATP synthase F1 subunit delta [Geobacteraceae bacterium]